MKSSAHDDAVQPEALADSAPEPVKSAERALRSMRKKGSEGPVAAKVVKVAVKLGKNGRARTKKAEPRKRASSTAKAVSRRRQPGLLLKQRAAVSDLTKRMDGDRREVIRRVHAALNALRQEIERLNAPAKPADRNRQAAVRSKAGGNGAKGGSPVLGRKAGGARDSVLAALRQSKAKQGLTANEIAARVKDFRPVSVRQALVALQRAGLVKASEGRPARYLPAK